MGGGQFHLDPETYLDAVRAEVPVYDDLQRAVASATEGRAVARVLDLGTGTGETARGVLALHPDATLIGVDASADMVAIAAAALPEADVRVGRLEDPLPAGPFDVVTSALAVHHLTDKQALFHRVADALAPDGLFVLADVVVPDDPGDAVTPLEAGVDRPDTLVDQLRWLAEAGLEPAVVWQHRDLVVVAADRD
jgi:tRNA (cmo5U34)-methyltransferase